MPTPSDDTQHLCAALNRFALPRAVAHLRENRFVAWNPSFRERTGLTDEAISRLEFNGVVRLGTLEANAGSFVEFIGCTMQVAGDQEPIAGLAARRADGHLYLMLDAVYPADSAFQHGRLEGLEEERRHVERVFLDQAGPKLLTAAFEVELAKRRLEASRLDAAPLAQASQALNEAIETLGAALDATNLQEPTAPSKSLGGQPAGPHREPPRARSVTGAFFRQTSEAFGAFWPSQGVAPWALTELGILYSGLVQTIWKGDGGQGLYSYHTHSRKAEAAFRLALLIFRKLVKQGAAEFLPDVAGGLSNVSTVYRMTNRLERAEGALLEALSISEALNREHPKIYLPVLVVTFINLGNVYMQTGPQRFDDGERAYGRAIEISQQLARLDPETYLRELWGPHIALGQAYLNNQRFDKAESEFDIALDISRKLFKVDPLANRRGMEAALDHLLGLCQAMGREDDRHRIMKEWVSL